MSIPHDPSVYEAIGTVGTLAVSTFVLLQTLLDRRRVQASKVNAWIDDNHAAELDVDHVVPIVVLSNSSEEAVHGVVVDAVGAKRSESIQEVPLILPPGRLVIEADTGALGAAGYLQDLPAPVTLAFTDSAGRKWHRLGRGGRLTRCHRWHKHAWSAYE